MDSDDIAIIGVGCRFPGADDLSEFWRVLSNGENHVKEIPKERWNVDAFYDKDPNALGKTYVRRAGLINRFDEWDHRFFGISDMEAKLIDPQQRMVLDCVHMALEEGSITRKDIEGTHTGVYIGVMNDDYKAHVLNQETASTYSMTGVHTSIISARVSYVYNLYGPAITLDTACSSSLVAINLGSQALRQGECDTAICGGVNCLMDPSVFVALSKARMLSPTGQCHTYSANADGYARGEGCGIVVLKRLSDAITQNNKIWATIKTGSNQDGHAATPITAPSGKQQIDLLQRVYGKHKVDKSTVHVIEAHGTGTPVGDPIEANALGEFFSGDSKHKSTVYIGSVKTNIGHLESAAGVAGLIKVLLMMRNELIVPSLMYTKENQNPNIAFDKYGFVVPTAAIKWPVNSNQSRVACVNSFGFGGTNAHAIVQQWTLAKKVKEAPKNGNEEMPYIITISGTDETALKENVKAFKANVEVQENQCSLTSLSYTSTTKRDHYAHRKAFLVDSKEQLISLCIEFINTQGIKKPKNQKQKIVFVFCGVGTTWKGMCKSMLHNTTFKQTIESIDIFLFPRTGWTIKQKLTEQNDSVQNDPFVGHISIFACQLGLLAVWKHLGISPDVVVGQSVGEVAAAYAAGCLDLESAVQVIYFRSKVLAEVNGGGMVFVNNIPIEELRQKCAASHGIIDIAVYNSPVSCTVAGERDSIKKLETELRQSKRKDVQVVSLDVKCAYHSKHVDTAVLKLVPKLSKLTSQTRKCQIISTVTGMSESHDMFATGHYWGKNIRQPVLFCDAIKAARSESENTIYVEVGPSPVLRLHLNNIFEKESVNGVLVLPSMTKGKEMEVMAQTLCTLYEHGINHNWEAIISEQHPTSDLLKYVFMRQKTLYQNPTLLLKNQGISTSERSHLYIERVPDVNGNPAFRATIDVNSTPFVYEHFVRGKILVPGAFYADIGSEIGKTVIGNSHDTFATSLEFLKPTKVENSSQIILTISTFTVGRDDVSFHVRYGTSVMCKGKVRKALLEAGHTPKVDIHQLRNCLSNSPHQRLTHDDMYTNLEKLGFKYGKYFHTMQDCIASTDSCLVDIEVPAEIDRELDRTTLHPCIIDGMMQSTVNMTNDQTFDMISKENMSFLPVAIEKLTVFQKPEKHMMLYTKRTNVTVLKTVMKIHYNCVLCSTDGTFIAEITNYTTYSRRAKFNTPDELKYRLIWQPLPQLTLAEARKLLLITNANAIHTHMKLEDGQCILCNPKKDIDSYESFLSEALLSAEPKSQTVNDVDGIIVLFDTYSIPNELDSNNACLIYDKTKENCMLLVALLKFMLNNNVKTPIFVATQNTQRLLLCDEPESVNLVGSEIWGLVRSIQTEFVHEKMTVVDLQPSVEATQSTFIDFVCQHVDDHSECNTEIIIHNDKVFAASFVKTDATELTPIFRKNYTIPNMLPDSMKPQHMPEYVIAQQFPLCLRSESSTHVSNVHVIPEDQTVPQKEKNTKKVDIIVKSVFLHPSFMYPATASVFTGEPDIWSEYQQEGHKVIGVEYTGFPIPPQSKGIFRYCSNRVVPEHEDMYERWEVATVFPSEMKTVMSIPKGCTINVRDIPFYKPGILAMSILFWTMVDLVPSKATVTVLCTTGHQFPIFLLERMLITIKAAKIIPQDIEEKSEVILSLNADETTCRILKELKLVICFKNAFSTTMLKALTNKNQIIVNEIDTQSVFQQKHVQNVLPKVVHWLKKNSSFITEEFERTSDTISLKTMGEQYQAYSKRSVDATLLGTSSLPFKMRIEFAFVKSSTYIITGGRTGLGWELLLLMAEMGAGTIVTLSRSAVTEDRASEIVRLKEKFSCNIVCIRADVCDLSSLKSAIAEIQNTKGNGKISGVFHGAGVLDSSLIINLDEAQLDHVLKAKVLGTMNLHIATKCFDLEYFVLQSSITSVIGQPGQSNYGAANAFLDTFATWRRQKGLSAQSINWGALEVGMAAKPAYTEHFLKRGYQHLVIDELRSCFLHAIMQNTTGIVYANLDWAVIARDYANPFMARLRLKVELILQERISGKTDFGDDKFTWNLDIDILRKADSETQRNIITEFVQKVAMGVIGTEIDELAMSANFAEIGMDSMSAMTFTNVVYDVIKCRISPQLMINQRSCMNDVVVFLLGELLQMEGTNEKTDREYGTTVVKILGERL